LAGSFFTPNNSDFGTRAQEKKFALPLNRLMTYDICSKS
jgi:hypothetical protein